MDVCFLTRKTGYITSQYVASLDKCSPWWKQVTWRVNQHYKGHCSSVLDFFKKEMSNYLLHCLLNCNIQAIKLGRLLFKRDWLCSKLPTLLECIDFHYISPFSTNSHTARSEWQAWRLIFTIVARCEAIFQVAGGSEVDILFIFCMANNILPADGILQRKGWMQTNWDRFYQHKNESVIWKNESPKNSAVLKILN